MVPVPAEIGKAASFVLRLMHRKEKACVCVHVCVCTCVCVQEREHA